jgi:Domain of unknown function (DUF4402)
MRLILALSILAVSAASAFAQSITVVNNLQFGNVFPGVPKAVAKTAAGAAAEFSVSGSAGSEVNCTFTLPTYVSRAGGHTMNLIFTKTDASMDSSASPSQSSPGYNNLDPWHTITYRLGSTGLKIWLGGQIVPKVVQYPGAYTGSIVLTVAYTGG